MANYTKLSTPFDNIAFWDNTPPLTTTFQPYTITSFSIVEWEIYNDSATNYIEYSFDGSNVHGKLKAGEIKVEPLKNQKIYLRGEVDNVPFRLWARG